MTKNVKNIGVLATILIFIAGFLTTLPAIAMNAKTELGPSLSRIADHTYLFHTGHNNDYIWEVRQEGGSWIALGHVRDHGNRNWVLSRNEPESVAHENKLYLFYKGHNNDRLWFTRKRVEYATRFNQRSFEEGEWDLPQHIPNIETSATSAVTIHSWSARDPSLNVAYTGKDERLHIQTARPWANPEYVHWYSVPSLPNFATTRLGPAAISFRDKLHIFYVSNSDQVYVVRGETNFWYDPGWTPPKKIAVAKTNRTPAVIHYRNALYMIFSGHNNPYIWVAKSLDGENWQSLGYIGGITSEERPDVTYSSSGKLILAFRPLHTTEVCIGVLTIDDSNAPGTPGHMWQNSRDDKDMN